jgi:hypothetical protein
MQGLTKVAAVLSDLSAPFFGFGSFDKSFEQYMEICPETTSLKPRQPRGKAQYAAATHSSLDASHPPR